MKSFLKYAILFAAVAVGGFFIQKACYRFPTEEEMTDYHEGHYATEVVSMSEQPEEERKDGLLVFRAEHTDGKGFTERYKVETGRAWVFPWETYWESRARLKED